MSLASFLKKEKSFIRIVNLLEILKNLQMSKYEIEKEIIGYKDTSSKESFFIKFPYVLSPLHIRVVGVLIGDGHIHKTTNLARWIQKDTTPLKKLIESVLEKQIYSNKEEMQVVIPAFFSKIICHALSLKFCSLATEEFIVKCLNLPKDYGLALLIALIEDEGNIDVKNCGGIDIRMGSKKIIFAIKSLCDYLRYKTSNTIPYKNKGSFGEGGLMYRIKINAEGIGRLGGIY